MRKRDRDLLLSLLFARNERVRGGALSDLFGGVLSLCGGASASRFGLLLLRVLLLGLCVTA
jgi:hypothetical protein